MKTRMKVSFYPASCDRPTLHNQVLSAQLLYSSHDKIMVKCGLQYYYNKKYFQVIYYSFFKIILYYVINLTYFNYSFQLSILYDRFVEKLFCGVSSEHPRFLRHLRFFKANQSNGLCILPSSTSLDRSIIVVTALWMGKFVHSFLDQPICLEV